MRTLDRVLSVAGGNPYIDSQLLDYSHVLPHAKKVLAIMNNGALHASEGSDLDRTYSPAIAELRRLTREEQRTLYGCLVREMRDYGLARNTKMRKLYQEAAAFFREEFIGMRVFTGRVQEESE